ncbi:MAG: hypothetical protein NWS40_01660 [Crocinitomicaceae bacterium]|jgi:hypothetical protein|nr:hypothetical protein [Crocinitomicaceae bacterium]MDP4867124.1 hypothetical protein [Crocinitomicaceae bacterium]MDP5011201.1 hypothetical protein [Crocinitomicaceae bacterium]
MKRSRIYSKQFFTAMLAVLTLYFLLEMMNVIPLHTEGLLLVLASIFTLFAIGVLIIAGSLDRDAEQLAIKFLLLTTVQMLLVFGLVGFVVLTRMLDFRLVGFHLLGLFCTLLGIQSYLLITVKNKSV